MAMPVPGMGTCPLGSPGQRAGGRIMGEDLGSLRGGGWNSLEGVPEGGGGAAQGSPPAAGALVPAQPG